MSHEEIIGQLFYQDNRCGCDECLESSRKGNDENGIEQRSAKRVPSRPRVVRV
jgi:hypothetical protein